MARKPGRPPNKGEKQKTMISVRVPIRTREALDAAVERNQRTLSREIVACLDYALGRGREDRPRHIERLADLAALVTQAIERRTKRHWHLDRYTAREVIMAMDLLVRNYSPRGEGEPEVPPDIPKELSAFLGTWEADNLISQIESAAAPKKNTPKEYFPEEWLLPWKIRRDLGSSVKRSLEWTRAKK
jgi:hypothetical protein